jgi:hypothetical protein
MSPILFNLYLGDAVRRWKPQMITLNFPDQFENRYFISTLMFPDDQVVTAFRAVQITNSYNLKVSIEETKVKVFMGKKTITSKLVLENKVIKQVNTSNFLECYISHLGEVDINHKTERLKLDK